ncbi:MAG: helix-turn-helix transcriptional regulator [Nonlabens sp.]
MRILHVKSLPIVDILDDFSKQLGVEVSEVCEVYSLKLPQSIGAGHITGVNFPNGVAWLQYLCKFNNDIEIHFTVNEIHPLKMLYNLGSTINHTFAKSNEDHFIERYQNLIVASSESNGHILKFPKNSQIRLNSVEIDRKTFKANWACDISNLNSNIKKALLDDTAASEYVFNGPYSLRVAQVFQSINSFKQEPFTRKMFLASKSFELIAQQLCDYSDVHSGVSTPDAESLEILKIVEELLESDMKSFTTVRALSNKLKITENKLQKIFKNNTGFTGNEYIKNKRMELIVELLENSTLSIGEISKLVGIDSTSYLSKIFKEKFLISPKEFRQKIANLDLTIE